MSSAGAASGAPRRRRASPPFDDGPRYRSVFEGESGFATVGGDRRIPCERALNNRRVPGRPVTAIAPACSPAPCLHPPARSPRLSSPRAASAPHPLSSQPVGAVARARHFACFHFFVNVIRQARSAQVRRSATLHHQTRATVRGKCAAQVAQEVPIAGQTPSATCGYGVAAGCPSALTYAAASASPSTSTPALAPQPSTPAALRPGQDGIDNPTGRGGA